MFAVAGPLANHHRTVADTGHTKQRILDLADLDPKTADLDLTIAAAKELQLAIRQPAAKVATPVKPLALSVRISHERQPRPLRIVDVPAPTQTPENTISPGAPSGTGDKCSSTT